MPNIVTLPNGETVSVPDSMSKEEARLHIVRKFPHLFNREQGFMPAMKSGFNTGVAAVQKTGETVAREAGMESVADVLNKWHTARLDRDATQFEPTTGDDVKASFENQGLLSGVGAFKRQWVTEPLGSIVGRYGPPTVAGAAAGAVAGPAAGLAAFMGPVTAMETGDNITRQEQQGQPVDLEAATAAGLVQAALARFGLGKYIHGAVGQGIAMREAAKLAPKVLSRQMSKEAAEAALGSTLRNVIAETGANAAVGTGMMVGTEALRRGQAGQDVAGPEALDEYKHMAAQAAILSPIFGGLHGAGARGKAQAKIGAEAQRGEAQRAEIAREQQQPEVYLEQKRQAEEAQAAAAATQLRAEEKRKLDDAARTPDLARRVVEQVEQPGVMDPARPLEMIPQEAGRRDMAREAFEQAQPDLLGEVRPPEEVPMQGRRAADSLPPAGPDPLQPELPLEAPKPHLPSEEIAPVREPAKAPAPLEEGAPTTTTRQQFDGMVNPRSPTYRNGALDGKDLANPEDVVTLTKTLKKYLRNVEDSERTAPQREALTKTINDLELLSRDLKMAAKKQPEAQQGEPIVAKPVDVVTDVPTLPKAENGRIQENGSNAGIDAGTNQPAVEVRGGRAAVPERLPEATGRGNAPADGPARTDVLRAQQDGDALGSVKSFAELPKLLDAKRQKESSAASNAATDRLIVAERLAAEKEQRALKQQLGRANAEAARALKDDARSAEKLDEAGMSIKADPAWQAAQAAEAARVAEKESAAAFTSAEDAAPLRQAVTSGKLDAVGAALESSTNPIIAHVGQQAKNVKGVKVAEAPAGEGPSYAPATRTLSIPKEKAGSEHAVAHETVHALTQTALDHPTPEQKPIVTKINHLYQGVKSKLGKEYGVTNLHEFVAEGFSNPKFQKKLASLKYANSTAWGKFTEYVAKLLGLKNDNALTELISLGEALEGTGLKVKSDPAAKPMKLGVYDTATKPEPAKGFLETVVKGARAMTDGSLSKTSAKSALTKFIDDMEQNLFNIDHGVTKHLDLKWTRIINGKTEATARALMQHAPYGIQIGRESMTVGGVRKNAEGTWTIVKDSNNFHTLTEAIDALPVAKGQDKFQTANGILNNLLYFERESAAKGAGTDMPPRPANVTDAAIAQARHDLATEPAVQKLVAVVKGINEQNIRTLEEGGVISADTAKLWRDKQHYVPMDRLMEDAEVPLGTLTRGGATIKTIHKFEGSERAVDDIMSNLIKQRLYVVDAAMRNNAAVKALHELMDVGGGDVTKLRGRPHHSENIVTVFENGKREFYKVGDAAAYRTFRGIEAGTNSSLMNGMENLTRMFREAIMLSPDAIFRNVVRDSTEAWAFNFTDKNLASFSKDIISQFSKGVPGVVRELVDGKVHRPRYDVMNFGVTGVREYTSLQREQQNIIREHMKGANPNDWAAYADRAITAAHHAWQGVAVEAELATRNRVFKDVLARTGSETEALMASINTLDFRRRGAWNSITVAKKLIPFFNSNLQGFYKIYRALARNDNLGMDAASARKMLMLKGARMAVAAAAYQSFMSQDEDYMNVSKDIRDHNMLVPIGNGQFMKLPVPFEFGALFWTVPANVVATMSGDQSGRELNKALAGAVKHNLPSIVPQAVKPIIEVATNHDFFTGRKLETDAQKRLEPGERTNSTTTDTAKLLAAGPVSPIMVDKLLKGYFGSLGSFAVSAVDGVIPDGPAAKPAKPWNKLPGIRSVVTDPLQSSSVDRFYELRESTSKVKETVDKLLKEGRIEEAKLYLKKNGPTGVPNQVLYGLDKPMDMLAKKLAEARRMSKQIENDTTMSPEMKRVQLEQIKRSTNAMVKQAMPTLRQASGE